MSKLRKHLIVYIDDDIAKFLKEKVDNGFKISSYIRFLVNEARKKESSDNNVNK